MWRSFIEFYVSTSTLRGAKNCHASPSFPNSGRFSGNVSRRKIGKRLLQLAWRLPHIINSWSDLSEFLHLQIARKISSLVPSTLMVNLTVRSVGRTLMRETKLNENLIFLSLDDVRWAFGIHAIFRKCSFAQMKISWNCSKRITQIGREVWKLQSFMLSIQFCKICSSCVLVDVNIKSVFHGFWSIFRELLRRLQSKNWINIPSKEANVSWMIYVIAQRYFKMS